MIVQHPSDHKSDLIQRRYTNLLEQNIMEGVVFSKPLEDTNWDTTGKNKG